MTDRQRIQKCVEHWEDMREDRKCGQEPIGKECALCRKYVLKSESCGKCPIRKKTGRDLCLGTPYQAAHAAFYHGTDEEWHAASTEMIEFLKALPEMKEGV